jgi:hypothetical protein
MTRFIIVLIAAYFLTSCTTVPPKTPEPEPAPVKLWLYQDVTYTALDTYGRELLKAQPADRYEWCSKWDSVNKRDFYNALLAHMATRESGRDPKQTFKESFNVKGEKCTNDCVISTGLLQVSQASCGSYGVKTTTEGLKDPATNLQCAVRILNQWVPRDGYVAKDKLGAGRYWSVMRPGSSKDYIRTRMKEWCA